MNNRFKFRVWDDGHGESKKGFWWSNDMVEFWTWIRNNHIPESNIQQYTGLNDKNGKEIYEGDIIDSFYYYDYEESWGGQNSALDDFRGKVEYDNEKACFYINAPALRSGKKEFCEIELKETKIIGNIFENPELLK